MNAAPNGVFGHGWSGVTGKREGQAYLRAYLRPTCGPTCGPDDAAACLTSTPPAFRTARQTGE